MAVLRYIVPALAVAAGAAAQSSSCGTSGGTTTIQSDGDASALSSCTTVSGSIALASGVTQINLNGIRSIEGNLVATGATSLTALSANSLQQIGGEFHLDGLTVLTTLNFPMLTEVDTVFWNALPNLGGLSFTTGLKQVSMLTIQNTQLSSLSGINLEVIDTFTLNNNPYLTEVNMQLGNVTKQFGMSANGKNLQLELPNLMWAYNMSIRDVSTVSLPSLASVNQSLGFYNDDIQSLSAPNLTNVGGSLTFNECNSLTNISMPQLTTVGGAFQLANNSALATINGFPDLNTIGGALDFYGTFYNASLPAITANSGSIRGAFNMRSTQNITDTCNHFKALSGTNQPIKGKFTCIPATTPNSNGSPTTGSTSASHTSSAASPMLLPGVTGLLGVFAAIFGLL